ncbi:MAG: prenyltransferase/squalene oxidase repeat-containing protein [Phycisphaerae bacterium]|nr:prenyltransferase/squalene oxidase repeat-containing protein [Phycisphaerae bacterium]
MTTEHAQFDPAALRNALTNARTRLLAERTPAGHWVGQLSSSALSTATATFALHCVDPGRFAAIIAGGLRWIIEHQNADGGWGDTTDSPGNVATTLLCWSATTALNGKPEAIQHAEQWLTANVGSLEPEAIVAALGKRYGRDRTFSVPILTMCALAGRLGPRERAWRYVAQLPFELAACPHRLLKFLHLGVVSYALPALIAIGQARHHFRPTRNPVARLLRNVLRRRTLAKLASIQPASGGFLEAAPLTSFVIMCLASVAQPPSAVILRGADFLAATVRSDGSWPIDTNLSVWVTTLSIKALAAGGDLAEVLSPDEREYLLNWLLDRQYKVEHPYTHAVPGGWAWTDLSGGVPDADDTAGALLAIAELVRAQPALECGDEGPALGETNDVSRDKAVPRPPAAASTPHSTSNEEKRCQEPSSTFPPPPGEGQGEGNSIDARVQDAAIRGMGWLKDLQNRDGGIPTFCRGWGKLPFDRSGADLTAHAFAAWSVWDLNVPYGLLWLLSAEDQAEAYLKRTQRADGSWLPLWFGDQAQREEGNSTYGTARVLLGAGGGRGADWLIANQNDDGGWGAMRGLPATIEQTAVAVEALCESRREHPGPAAADAIRAGVAWLIANTRGGTEFPAAPIGLYFAKLWYSEKLYPLIFTVAALGRAARVLEAEPGGAHEKSLASMGK